MGRNMIIEMIIEWVMVRCSMPGISMSMSGISENRNTRGRLISCFRSLADPLASK